MSIYERALRIIVLMMALAVLTLVAMILIGCTAMTQQEQAALRQQASGCYCAGKECKQISSASGSAAREIAAARKLREVEFRGRQ